MSMDTIANNLKGDTGRLAATYLAIIMALTLLFSGIIFAISSSQFNRPLPRGSATQQLRAGQNDYLQTLFERRAQEARAELIASLLIFNTAVLIAGGVFSYVLARKSLQPIEAAMESQARFVSDASHELRTPLAALQVTNEVALRKKKLTVADAKELIGYNLSETIKLRDLSEALLGLARHNVDTTKRDINIAEVVLDAVQTLQPLADEKHIVISHDVPALSLHANQSAMTQIVRILLDNAIKYSPEKSTVGIAAKKTDKDVTVSVVDEGVGIEQAHRSRIFDRFYRIDESRSSNNVSGSGLGLSIAKAIADRHGYRLELATGKRAKGSTFNLTVGQSN